MAQTAAQIVSLACQIAKVTGFVAQAQLLLNSILEDLCRNYDFDLAKKTYNFTLSTSINGGAGPFPLPADYLRADLNDVFYTIDGVPYFLISCDNNEYDAMVQTAGFNSYPLNYTTFMSPVPFSMKVWPPTSGAYPMTIRYRALMPAIVNFDTEVPWFPNNIYLRTRLAGELCQLAGDARWEALLSDDEDNHPAGAGVILRKYQKMQDDKSSRVATVTLDRRRFASNFGSLKNTKRVGW